MSPPRVRIYKRPPLAIAAIVLMFFVVSTGVAILAVYRLVEYAALRAFEYIFEPCDPFDRVEGEKPPLDTFPEYRYFGVWRRRV